jgi:hypothetical protein
VSVSVSSPAFSRRRSGRIRYDPGFTFVVTRFIGSIGLLVVTRFIGASDRINAVTTSAASRTSVAVQPARDSPSRIDPLDAQSDERRITEQHSHRRRGRHTQSPRHTDHARNAGHSRSANRSPGAGRTLSNGRSRPISRSQSSGLSRATRCSEESGPADRNVRADRTAITIGQDFNLPVNPWKRRGRQFENLPHGVR